MLFLDWEENKQIEQTSTTYKQKAIKNIDREWCKVGKMVAKLKQKLGDQWVFGLLFFDRFLNCSGNSIFW